ncbi:DUF1269 domain-containing protein [Streptomyces sp. NBC_01334]|uniref:DUF1269 domain-containing protein n=1 Tax=Streptomyces sp. NBC_01334 TaxID=2903827 RepID=UPI002E14CF82|nr:DUF1269 domain-containing protein [Streptomyces sp. NBC_01334]
MGECCYSPEQPIDKTWRPSEVEFADRHGYPAALDEWQEHTMATPDAVFIFIGTYPSEATARADYEVVKDLHAVGAVGTYDASVVTKDDTGKVHVNKDETATRHGAWGGAAAGAVVGLLFPPAIIGTAAVGAAVGGVSGHLWRGMSRADVKEFGDLIDEGQAALVIVGESTLSQALDKAQLKAEKRIAKELDVSAKDVDKAVQQAAKEVD